MRWQTQAPQAEHSAAAGTAAQDKAYLSAAFWQRRLSVLILEQKNARFLLLIFEIACLITQVIVLLQATESPQEAKTDLE